MRKFSRSYANEEPMLDDKGFLNTNWRLPSSLPNGIPPQTPEHQKMVLNCIKWLDSNNDKCLECSEIAALFEVLLEVRSLRGGCFLTPRPHALCSATLLKVPMLDPDGNLNQDWHRLPSVSPVHPEVRQKMK